MTTALVLNLALSVFIFAVIIGKLVYAIATQQRDLGVTHERRTASRRQPAPAPRFGAATRRHAWPAV